MSKKRKRRVLFIGLSVVILIGVDFFIIRWLARERPETLVLDVSSSQSSGFFALQFGQDDGQEPDRRGTAWVLRSNDNAFVVSPKPSSTVFKIRVINSLTNEMINDSARGQLSSSTAKYFWILNTDTDGVTWLFVGTQAEYDAIWSGQKHKAIRAGRYQTFVN